MGPAAAAARFLRENTMAEKIYVVEVDIRGDTRWRDAKVMRTQHTTEHPVGFQWDARGRTAVRLMLATREQ